MPVRGRPRGARRMARLRDRSLSKRVVEALWAERDTVYWDSALKGFGVRVYPTGAKVYVVQSRGPGIHDLRHSFASRALALGESLPMIGKLLGHSKMQTTVRSAGGAGVSDPGAPGRRGSSNPGGGTPQLDAIRLRNAYGVPWKGTAEQPSTGGDIVLSAPRLPVFDVR